MQAVACACHTPYYTLIINKNCKNPNTQVTWETELSCKPEGHSVPPFFTSCIWTPTSESPTVSQNGTPIWGPSVQAHEAGGGTLHVQWDNVRWHGWCLQSESSCIFFSPTSARLEAFYTGRAASSSVQQKEEVARTQRLTLGPRPWSRFLWAPDLWRLLLSFCNLSWGVWTTREVLP